MSGADPQKRRVTVSAPVNLFARTYDRERVLRDLQTCGVGRVLLCGQTLSMDSAERRKVYDKLPEEIRFFRSHGVEVWYWRWTFMVPGHTFTKVVSYRGTSPVEVCPLDPDFLKLTYDDIAAIAATGVDGILYDDDFRFDNGNIGLGCFCERHKALVEKYLGHPMQWENVEEQILCGAPGAERSALMKAWGDSMREFARISRAAVDSVDPAVRLGICSCLSCYDGNGASTMELAQILAGKTRPYVRLIGAPYWAERWKFRMRLPEIIEYERYQSVLMPEEYEVFTEGDVYPRPRFQIPASYLEIFDSALRFDGTTDGIQKYMFDYTSSAGYETGYMDQHIEHLDFYAALPALLAGTESAGIRVWQNSRLIENGDFRDLPYKNGYLNGPLYYPQSAFALAPHGIPSVHKGSGCAAICFGESARTLPEEFKSRPLILDITAAMILKERGWNTGLLKTGEWIKPSREDFPDGESVPLLNRYTPSRRMQPVPGAEILSRFDEQDEIASYRYCAPDGGRYLVFNFDGTLAGDTSWRNYRFPAVIRSFLKECGATLPAVLISPVPDLYLQCRTGADSCVIGFWNAHPDRVKAAQISLASAYQHAEWLYGAGDLDGNMLTIRNLQAFSFMAVRLSRKKI